MDDVDYVVAVTVDDKDSPKRGLVYMMVDSDEMRERFNRAYRARLDAGHGIPLRRGVWVSVFVAEDPDTPSSGIALGKQPLLIVKLDDVDSEAVAEPLVQTSAPHPEAPLTIAEAKRRLAQSLGVDPREGQDCD